MSDYPFVEREGKNKKEIKNMKKRRQLNIDYMSDYPFVERERKNKKERDKKYEKR